MTTVYKFKVFYTISGVGSAPAVAPTVTVVDSDNNIVVNAQAATALSNLPGVYLYNYSGADDLDLIAVFHTNDNTVDQQDLPSYTPDILTRNLDERVSSLSTLGNGSVAYTPNRAVDPDGNPLDGVDTWVNTNSSDSSVGVVARASTNALGLIESPFLLDPGTYYVWRQLGQYAFENPETVVVS